MAQHRVEVFSAGCILCEDALELVRELAGSRSTVQVHDMSTGDALLKVREYGVTRVPAVVIDGQLAPCCEGGGMDELTLRSLGLTRS